MILPRPFTVSDYLGLRGFEQYYGPQFDVSPCGTHICFACQRGMQEAPFFGVPFMAEAERGRLYVWSVDMGEPRHIPERQGTGLFSPVWSPDGRWIAIALAERNGVYPAVVNAETGTISALSKQNLSLRSNRRPILWISESKICCELLDEGSLPFGLTSERNAAETLMQEWPNAWSDTDTTARLFSTTDKRTGWDWGMTTVLDVETGAALMYDQGVARPDPVLAFETRETYPYPVPRVPLPEDRGGVRLYVLDLPDWGHRISVESDNSGTKILWSRQEEDIVLPFDANPHLCDVTAGRVQELTFTIPGQGEARSHLVLPPVNVAGRLPPCVVWVYPETNVRGEAVPQDILNSTCLFNTQLLAARGYAVLRPDLPLPKELNELTITETLTVAVQAAVAAAVESGLIDGDNLHVAGHSHGGWAAMTLLTTTRMFRSGIAMAGAYNMLSFFGQLDPRTSMDSVPRGSDELCAHSWRLPQPPWRQPDRYIRESPLFSVEAVEAPVLLIHGDQDYLPIQQAEEMFSALRYLGKSAELLRFCGEGHILASPKNVRAMYEKIFEWLEKHRH
jgi:dipeptidyl aminopeptidase/acylaminoacyl peptidase